MIGGALHTLSRNLGEEGTSERTVADSSRRCLLAGLEKTPFPSEQAHTMKIKPTKLQCRAAYVTVGVILTFTLMCGAFLPGQDT
jgi:hypothetical protein